MVPGCNKINRGKEQSGMNSASYRRALLLRVLVLVAAMVLATAGVAWARTPITVSEHTHKETGTFTGYVNCRGEELYDISVTFNELVRVTAAGVDEDGEYLPPLHFHHTFTGKFVAVPVDGTGPTFTGHGRDTETFNAKSFDEFVGTYTNQHKVVAKGSDGSKINYHLHVRYSVNAKGEVTVDFFRVKPDESCITPGE
jgi:hypothetical protein